jgi:hypothetical protein
MLCPYVRRASAKTSFELMPQQPASSLSTVSVNRTAWGRTRCKIDLGLESLLSVKRQRRDIVNLLKHLPAPWGLYGCRWWGRAPCVAGWWIFRRWTVSGCGRRWWGDRWNRADFGTLGSSSREHLLFHLQKIFDKPLVLYRLLASSDHALAISANRSFLYVAIAGCVWRRWAGEAADIWKY